MFHSPYLHFTLVASGFFLFAFLFFVLRLAGMFSQLRRKWNPPAPYQPQVLAYNKSAATFWSFFVLIGLLFLTFSHYLTRYQYIEPENAEPAGTATFSKGTVHFTMWNGESIKQPVRGHQAAAAGIFLRFPSWMRYLGLGTYHKIITFRGFYENEYHYKHPPIDFLKPYADSLFLFCYKNNKWLSLPYAFYTESPYFNPGTHRIIVTPSGYITQ